MFQSFETSSNSSLGAKRLSALRDHLRALNLAGFLIPRADLYQGENVAPCDERLAWLTGFTGSAGTCVALLDKAAIFVDGRYTLAVRGMVDTDLFQPLQIPMNKIADWLKTSLPDGGEIGFDPWLHNSAEIDSLSLESGLRFRPISNLVDEIWHDRPNAPQGKMAVHPIEFAGETHQSKRERLAEALRKANLTATTITAPDSIAWLLNIRGSDIAHTPVAHALAILHDDGKVALFVDAAKLTPEVRIHLGNHVALHALETFGPMLEAISGQVGIDASTPVWVNQRLKSNSVLFADPCVLPMARKNATELAGMRAAHQRDGAAMANFLCWLAQEAPSGRLTEIDVVRQLETFRSATGHLKDISFNTICGAGPNGAIVHYRVTESSNRRIEPGEVLLVDSGGQYLDGTTDITRTIAIGSVAPAAARAFTLVLKGMIAISLSRWPVGLSGRDLDSFARQALWQAGMDYDHGTGHGVGSYLDVHEGPQGISRRTTTPLEAGMVLSNEPGYYREGAFGIRIENLVIVTPAKIPEGGDRPMHGFETLTLAPIDRAMILPDMLNPAERAWLNNYHQRVSREVGPLLDSPTKAWLATACAAI